VCVGGGGEGGGMLGLDVFLSGKGGCSLSTSCFINA
jgi:hypothetical protein